LLVLPLAVLVVLKLPVLFAGTVSVSDAGAVLILGPFRCPG
jgi:hypothetical protein